MPNILLVGATSAIAQALAHEFAARGATLVLWGRSPERLQTLGADLRIRWGGRVETETVDVNACEFHSAEFNRAVMAVDGLDAAVICHGSLSNQEECERDFSKTEEQLRTNCLSVISLLTLSANYFQKRRKGTIVAISSVAGDRGRQSNYVYGTAKAALNVFLQGMRNRLYLSGVKVITVKPGFVATPMTGHLKKGVLFASPRRVGQDILRAIERGRPVVYTPWFWRYIMLIIKLIPETFFQRLKL